MNQMKQINLKEALPSSPSYEISLLLYFNSALSSTWVLDH